MAAWLDIADIQRLHLGHFTAPADHPLAGKQIVVTAFLIRHPSGPVLFDTGMAEKEIFDREWRPTRAPAADEMEVRYRPVRRDLTAALATHGVGREDVRVLANCHLHFDHAGGNHLFPRTPIFCQRVEHEAAGKPDYTLPAAVAQFSEARFELLNGEADILPGLRLIPTPGHTDGHQSLIVETKQGRVILAGQAFLNASEHAVAAYAHDLAKRGEPHAEYPAWIERFAELDPWRVMFAHDLAIWHRGV